MNLAYCAGIIVCYVFSALDYIAVSVIMFGMNSYLTHIE